jgi:hypothetical protein
MAPFFWENFGGAVNYLDHLSNKKTLEGSRVLFGYFNFTERARHRHQREEAQAKTGCNIGL